MAAEPTPLSPAPRVGAARGPARGGAAPGRAARLAPRDVVAFAEALDRPALAACGPRELGARAGRVLTLLRVLAAKRPGARRAARGQDEPCGWRLTAARPPAIHPSSSRSSRRARTRRRSPRPRTCSPRSRSPSRSAWRSPRPRDARWFLARAGSAGDAAPPRATSSAVAYPQAELRRARRRRAIPGLDPARLAPGRAGGGLRAGPARARRTCRCAPSATPRSTPTAAPRPTRCSASSARWATCPPAGAALAPARPAPGAGRLVPGLPAPRRRAPARGRAGRRPRRHVADQRLRSWRACSARARSPSRATSGTRAGDWLHLGLLGARRAGGRARRSSGSRAASASRPSSTTCGWCRRRSAASPTAAQLRLAVFAPAEAPRRRSRRTSSAWRRPTASSTWRPATASCRGRSTRADATCARSRRCRRRGATGPQHPRAGRPLAPAAGAGRRAARRAHDGPAAPAAARAPSRAAAGSASPRTRDAPSRWRCPTSCCAATCCWSPRPGAASRRCCCGWPST